MDEKFVARRILIIDDEEGFLKLASLQFGKRNHKVTTALNCETGLNLQRAEALGISKALA